jgi:hypothetical protein
MSSYTESKKAYNRRPEEKEKRRIRTAEYLSRPEIKERSKKYRESPHRKALLRKNDLWRKYKITPEDYDNMALEQGGLCLICDRVPKKRLVVDHNHHTGEVRGLLCDPCNVALGFLEDNTKFLLRAIEYLK